MDLSILPSDIHVEIVSFLDSWQQRELRCLSSDLCSSYYRSMNKLSFSSEISNQLFIRDLSNELREHLEYLDTIDVAMRRKGIVDGCLMFRSYKILNDMAKKYPYDVIYGYFNSEYRHHLGENTEISFDEFLSKVPSLALSISKEISRSNFGQKEFMQTLFSIIYWQIDKDPENGDRCLQHFADYINVEIIHCFVDACQHVKTPPKFREKIQKLQSKYGRFRQRTNVWCDVDCDPYWRPY